MPDRDPQTLTELSARLAAGETHTFSEAETAIAVAISRQLGFVKDDGAGAAMVAWYPPADLAAELALPGQEPPEALHLTVAYMPAGQYDPASASTAAAFAAHQARPLSGQISGVGRFALEDNLDCVFLTVDVPGLDELRDCVIDCLERTGCVVDDETHGFTPHVTLAYLQRGQQASGFGMLNEAIPITIDAVTLATQAGGRIASFALGGPQVAPQDVEEAAETGDDDDAGLAQSAGGGAGLEYQVVKSVKFFKNDGSEWQYTLGPIYAPDMVDAHGEYTDDDELYRAILNYSASDDSRRLHLQHGDQEGGKWLELMRWPYDHEIQVQRADGSSATKAMPAGSVYMGVLWDDGVWPAVKDGRIGGLSIGGRAVRVRNQPQPDGGSMAPDEVKDAVAKQGKCQNCGAPTKMMENADGDSVMTCVKCGKQHG